MRAPTAQYPTSGQVLTREPEKTRTLFVSNVRTRGHSLSLEEPCMLIRDNFITARAAQGPTSGGGNGVSSVGSKLRREGRRGAVESTGVGGGACFVLATPGQRVSPSLQRSDKTKGDELYGAWYYLEKDGSTSYKYVRSFPPSC